MKISFFRETLMLKNYPVCIQLRFPFILNAMRRVLTSASILHWLNSVEPHRPEAEDQSQCNQ